MSSENKFRENIRAELIDQEKRARSRVITWNIFFYSTLLASIIFSAAAALIPQLAEDASWRDWTTACAILAATLTTLIHVMGFERRWRASRYRLAGTHQLRNETIDPEFDPRQAVNRLNEIIKIYHEETGIAAQIPQKINIKQ